MMRLRVHALPNCSDDYMSVGWMVGMKNGGVVHVTGINVSSNTAVLQAEAWAIKYLLYFRKVLNRDVFTGKGMEVTVSSSKIKKIVTGKLDNKILNKHLRFIGTALSDARIECKFRLDDKTSEVFKMGNVEQIDIKDLEKNVDCFDSVRLGKVRLTQHAIKKFSENEVGEVKDPFGSLKKQLSHAGLRKERLPAKVLAHKKNKYGTTDNLEVWTQDSSTLHFIVIRGSDGVGSVVSLYWLANEFKD